MNKETLEKVAERVFKTHSNNISLAEGDYDYMMDKEDFKEASLEITKWQQERNEEDMQEYAKFCIICYNEGLPCIVAKDWFEQFKKK
jgi:hypothetical protein